MKRRQTDSLGMGPGHMIASVEVNLEAEQNTYEFILHKAPQNYSKFHIWLMKYNTWESNANRL